MAQTSFATVMLAIAASVALLLALLGVYGVLSFSAAERTYESGCEARQDRVHAGTGRRPARFGVVSRAVLRGS
jgi:heme O synthase-like polyprenyltransferase